MQPEIGSPRTTSSRRGPGGGELSEVRERYVAVRARLEREAAEAKGAPVPAGAPGRFVPEPASAFEKIREGLTRLNA